MNRRQVGALGARRRTDSGATALEFGLVAPIIFLLMFAVVQYGYFFWSLTTASATAREAARRMVVGRDWTTCAQPHAVEHVLTPTVDASSIAVSYRYTDEDGTALTRPHRIGDLVEVTVAFDTLNLNIPLVPLPHQGLVTQKVTAKVQNIPDSVLPCDDTPGA